MAEMDSEQLQQADNRRSIELTIVALVLVCCACIPFAFAFAGADAAILTSTGLALRGGQTALAWSTFGFVVTAIAGCAAMQITRLLKAPALYIVLLQLCLVLLAGEVYAASRMQIEVGLLSTAAAIALGAICGVSLKRLSQMDHASLKQQAELAMRNREAVEAQLQLVRQDEVERRLLAGDLHDQVLNDLKAMRQVLKEKLTGQDAAGALDEQVATAMVSVRQVMDNLSPVDIEHLGLCDALEACIEKGAPRGGYKVLFRTRCKGETIDKLSKLEQTLLYRLVQEIVNNICKHAGAKTVDAEVTDEGNELVLRITDDGKGIDPETFKSESRGIRYMRQRANLIGATIGWKPGKDSKGVTVEIRVLVKGSGDGH